MKNFEGREFEVGDFLFGPNPSGRNTYHVVESIDERGFWTYYIGRTGGAVKTRVFHFAILGKNFITVLPEYIDEDMYFDLCDRLD